MSSNEFLFGVVPYAAALLAVVVTIARWRLHPFSVSSLSSQLLESRKLYWGSVPFHWGLSLTLVGHLGALVVPSGFEVWNGAPLRLYMLEITGFALAVWAAFGIAVLVYRRLSEPRIRRVTTPMDLVVLGIIAFQIATGIWTAVAYRWGSFWGTAVLVPYIRSLLVFQPDPSYVEPLPWIIKLHVLSFFVFLAAFPFSRLVHIITLPLQYFFRPWQKVIANRRAPHPEYVRSERPRERAR
jgi:nitrate reductase gamma subunit